MHTVLVLVALGYADVKYNNDVMLVTCPEQTSLFSSSSPTAECMTSFHLYHYPMNLDQFFKTLLSKLISH